MENSEVITKVDGNAFFITLNRPEKLNALNKRVREMVIHGLQEASEMRDIRVVVLSGNGKAFCAGADIENLLSIASAESVEKREEIADRNTITEIGLKIRELEKPVIAAVHGYCFGGGFELVQYCDMIYATADALFSQPEVNIGIIPGGGGTQNLPRIIGDKFAKEMIFTGKRVTAEETHAYGIVNKVFPTIEEMNSYVREITEQIVSKPYLSIANSKRAVNASMNVPLNEGLMYERELIKNLYGAAKTRELLENFFKRRKK